MSNNPPPNPLVRKPSARELLLRRTQNHGFMAGVEHNGQALCSWCDLPKDDGVHEYVVVDYGDDGEVIESKIIPTVNITRAYIAGIRSTLYGRSFDLHNNLEAAAEWLAKEVDRVNAIRNMAISSSYSIEEIVERARKLEVM